MDFRKSKLSLILIPIVLSGCLELSTEVATRLHGPQPKMLLETGPREILVAIGKMQRTTMSCDNGQTWIWNRSMDDSARCWEPGGPECDHHAGSGLGLTYDRGTFVATFGWGGPSQWNGAMASVMTTNDGLNWNNYPRNYATTGPAAGNGTVVTFTFNPVLSTDFGATWVPNPSIYIEPNPRRTAFIPDNEGTFLLFTGGSVAGQPVRSAWRSVDDGATWIQTNFATACGINAAELANGNGVTIVSSTWQEMPCRSADGGVTWSTIEISNLLAGDSFQGSVLYSQGEFIMFGRSHVYVSSNQGLSWTRTPMVKTFERPLRPSYIIEAANGDFVGVNQEWGNYYDRQDFIVSKDRGRTWDRAAAYAKSHPITGIKRGHVSESFCAP